MNDLDATKYLWDRNSKEWFEAVVQGHDIFNDYFGIPYFVGQLPNINGKVVLDAGCGEGRSTRAIYKEGSNVIGVDISPKMLDFARLQERPNNNKIKYIESSCDFLCKNESNSIDIVTSYMSLMDMPNIDQVFGEFARVLKSDGEIFMMVRHPCFFTRGFSILKTSTGQRSKLTVSDYFGNSPYINKFSFPGHSKASLDIIRFPYKLSTYISLLIKNGFVISDLQEPVPSDDNCLKYPQLNFWKTNAAVYLYLRARKTKNAIRTS